MERQQRTAKNDQWNNDQRQNCRRRLGRWNQCGNIQANNHPHVGRHKKDSKIKTPIPIQFAP